MARDVSLRVNGRSHTVKVDDPSMPLLYLLRNDLTLNGPKFGCGLAQCGACTVIMNGAAIRSCSTPVEQAEGQEVTTLEGLGTVKTWTAPISNESVTVTFKQAIGANEPLRTGSYSKTLTFTLSTTNP